MTTTRSRQALALLTLALVLVLLAPTGLAAEDHDNTDPTAWQWHYGQTEAQISAVVASGFRLVDLEVEQGSPARFTAAFVQNSGSYGKGWWWYYNISLSQVGSLLSQNNGRLIDFEPYEVSGQIRYAVVMVSNTGSDAKAWWYSMTTNLQNIVDTYTANNARVVDVEVKTLLGQTWYAAVMIRNTGADAKDWSWWIGASSSFLASKLPGNRLVDLERRGSSYDFVVVENTEDMHWWYWVGMTEAALSEEIAQAGARVQSLQRVDVLGVPRFYAVLHNNSNELTTRIGDILRNSEPNGDTGLYLKQVNGPVLASLQQDFAFEPASTIKTLMNVHAFREISLGNASLGENLTVWTGLQGTSCPIYTDPVTEDMSTVLELMMQDSDNNRTAAIRDRFGLGNINATAPALGMTATWMVHTLGCGGPPPNSMTLADGGRLHEAVANGYLGGWRDAFYDHMLTSVTGYGADRLGVIIDQEAAALGLPALVLADFKDRMAMAYKGGSYGYGNPLDYYWSVLAWARIPFLQGGQVVAKEYVSGVFIHDNPDQASIGATMDEAGAELLRDEIAAALATWAGAEASAWVNLGGGQTGSGVMQLEGFGSLVGGTAVSTVLTGAVPNQVASLVFGFSFLNAPFKGGTWGPFPDLLFEGIPTGPAGSISLPSTWPTGVPAGVSFYVQWWMADSGAPLGFAGSNTIRGTTP